jgi:DNA-directed RNA polymerase subunit L
MGIMVDEQPNENDSVELKEDEEEEILVEEEQEEMKDYKHLKARLIEQKKDTYRIEFIDASHGFLNFLSNILLKEKGVKYSAYKKTSLGNPIMTIITDGSVSIKKILQNAGKKINDELNAIQSAFKTAIK